MTSAQNGNRLSNMAEQGGHTADDELIAVRCQLGEADAFNELIRRWNDPIWRYVRRLAGNDDDAAEMVQDIWLRVVRGISRLRDASRLRPWLFGIARRVAMDRLRNQYAAPSLADIDMDGIASDDDVSAVEDDLAAMENELARLPVVEREVLTLFYLNELSLAEVADVMGVPVGTVKSRLFRARRLLRSVLTPQGDRQ